MKTVKCEEELLIACALKKELKALRKRLQLKCHFIVTGVGFQKTVASLENYFQRERRPAFFVFTGTAGQLDPSLEIGEIVLPEEWCIQDGPCFSVDEKLVAELRQYGWKIEGRGLTVARPVLKAKSRMLLHQQSKALVCDMESAGALQVARKYDIPSVAPKVISDTANSGVRAFRDEFDNNIDRLADYLEKFIRYPHKGLGV